MKNLNPLLEYYKADKYSLYNTVDEKIAKIIFQKYPTLNDLIDGCEDAYLRTGNKIFKKIANKIANTPVQVYRFAEQISQEELYYMALLQFINRHKAWRRFFISLAGTIGGAAVGGIVGAAIDDAGPAFGLPLGMLGGTIGGEIYQHKKILRKSQNNIYDAYKKDHDVDNMLSKLY